MTETIVWKFASERELAQLATQHSVEDCKSALAEMFNLDQVDEKQSLLLDLHFSNYSQQHFELNQTSVFLGLCQELMSRDFASDSSTDLNTSFGAFEAMLFTHSVNRSPKSAEIFTQEDVAAIVDYVTNTYYRHFQLYKAIYTPNYHVHLIQREINDIETPRVPCALSEGTLEHSDE